MVMAGEWTQTRGTKDAKPIEKGVRQRIGKTVRGKIDNGIKAGSI